MLRNWLTIALRSLVKSRLYSLINILGLAVGLASCVMILLYVRDEMSYDRWIPEANSIYRIHSEFEVPGRASLVAVTTPGPTMAALVKDFPQIEAATRFLLTRPVVHRGDEVFYEEMMVADGTVFDVFEFPWLAGDRATALEDPAGLVLTESAARKYFGEEPALGQTMRVTFLWGEREMRVTGVMRDLPHNTHFKFPMLATLHEPDMEKYSYLTQQWTSVNTFTYVKLKPGADPDAIRRALPEFEARNIPDELAGGTVYKTSDQVTLSMMSLTDLHLRARGVGVFSSGGDITTVYTFSIVAVMILLIACINFTNLATARASQRAREVALRKVLGAKRHHLIVQFLGESVLLAVVALLVALAMVELTLPAYGAFLQRDLALSYLGAGSVALELLVLMVLVGIAGGAYPALYLSRFRPARILKANKAASAEGSTGLRMALVIIQFAISITLVVCTAVVYGQTLYARSMETGFNKSGLLSVRGIGREEAKPASDALKREVARIPGVVAVTRSQDSPADQNENNTIIELPGRTSSEPVIIGTIPVDYDFFSTMEIPLLAGRALSEDYALDDFTGSYEQKIARGGNVVISRNSLQFFGISDPADAVGRQFRIGVGSTPEETDLATVTIVGVVGDVQFRSARDQLRPLIYYRDAAFFNYIIARISDADPGQVREAAGGVWRELVPSMPFLGIFVEDQMANQYTADSARGAMFAAFAGLAIIVACLGLFGLASFAADRRTKEIGIRKVLGARVRDVVRLLVWDFSKPVVIANLIAWPAAWLVMSDWLEGFEQRIDLNPAVFAGAGALALGIALVTVAVHAARVATANPIHALRYE